MRVAVIGAGASGLAATKACLEAGIQVKTFEKTDKLGGLWQYREYNIDGVASVMYSTTTNTSKEMSAFSDFPPPPEFPNYMHNSFVAKYLEMYADHFKLRKHVLFQHEVMEVWPSDDYLHRGRWNVKVKDLKQGLSSIELFDAVMVCTGYDWNEVYPKFPGLDAFEGPVIHARDYKRPNGFENKKVLVIGAGNSAADVATELSSIAEKVYLSTRSGCWTIPRVGLMGEPYDALSIRRIWNIIFHILPYHLSCMFSEYEANRRFNHHLYNLKPCHRFHSQHATITDYLPSKILNGTVIVKPGIREFSKNCVYFEWDNEAFTVDSVILATGYTAKFPFLSDNIVKVEDNFFSLFKFVFPTNLQHSTLAFIGSVQPEGSLFPISELQSRWVAEVFNKRLKLPSQAEMEREVRTRKSYLSKRYFSFSRHARQVDWIDYMDEIAEIIGCKPNLIKLSFTDFRLYCACVFGPCLPYQYRLEGPNKWDKAREEIMSFRDKYKRGLKNADKSKALPRVSFLKRAALLLVFAAVSYLQIHWFWMLPTKTVKAKVRQIIQQLHHLKMH